MLRAAWLHGRAPALALWLLLGVAPAVLLGCAGASGSGGSRRSAVERNDAVVTIVSNVPDAEVWIDDRFVAQAKQLPKGIAVRAGEHRLELRHDRYHTHYQELSLAARERKTLEIELAPVLP